MPVSKARGESERQHSCQHVHTRNSSWFYKCSRVQKIYSIRHNIRHTNAISHELLVTVKKGLSSTSTRLWDLQRKDQCREWSTLQGTRLIIPEKLHNRTLQTTHEGHFGVENMQMRAKESVFQQKVTADILQSSKVCQTFLSSQQRAILRPHEDPQGSWKKIGANFFVCESTNCLLITDYYSQFPIIGRMRSTMSHATIHVMKQSL